MAKLRDECPVPATKEVLVLVRGWDEATELDFPVIDLLQRRGWRGIQLHGHALGDFDDGTYQLTC